MSWLKLRRLLPATKAWKIFKTKLQTKLHKLNRSKAIKKPQNRYGGGTSAGKLVSWRSLSFQSRFKRKTQITQLPHALFHNHRRRHRRDYYQKSPPTVYIDQLFIEPAAAADEYIGLEKCSTSGVGKRERSEEGEDGKGKKEMNENHPGDEMWESLPMASPQMYAINERAEEFIAKFRAQMNAQEKL